MFAVRSVCFNADNTRVLVGTMGSDIVQFDRMGSKATKVTQGHCQDEVISWILLFCINYLFSFGAWQSIRNNLSIAQLATIKHFAFGVLNTKRRYGSSPLIVWHVPVHTQIPHHFG